MAPAHLIGCGIVCAEGMLSHYPYSMGQEDQRHWINSKMGEKEVSTGPYIVPGSTIKETS